MNSTLTSILSILTSNLPSRWKRMVPLANAFLDTETTRQQDGSIAVSLYRKFPHTDRCLDFKSHHHTQHKHSELLWIAQKKKNSPSNEEEILLETKYVTQALFANNYPTHFLRKGHQLNTEREISANDADQGGLVILPYAKGFSEKIARVLKSFSIKVEHKRIRIISNILKKPIERTSEEAVRGAVYRVRVP